jgi:hypothetical protein
MQGIVIETLDRVSDASEPARTGEWVSLVVTGNTDSLPRPMSVHARTAVESASSWISILKTEMGLEKYYIIRG